MARHFQVTADMPELGLHHGDSISYDAADEEQRFLLIRHLGGMSEDVLTRAVAWGLVVANEPADRPANQTRRSRPRSGSLERAAAAGGLRLVR